MVAVSEYVYECQQFLPRAPEEVFPFFAAAGNLDLLTPPWLHFVILTPMPVTMRAGLELDYRLRWRGIPLRWRTRIEAWEPGVRFVDARIRGPYRLWHHTHLFEAVNGGTRMTDIVRYALSLGVVGRLVHGMCVRADV